MGTILTEPARRSDRRRGHLYLSPEMKRYHQQYLYKNANGCCPSHSTGVSRPIGLGVNISTGVKAEPELAATS
jgi:hypothetical protein